MSDERKPQADAGTGLDNLFRNALESHQIEPPGSIWKGISRKLLRAELARFNFTNLPKAFWIGAAGVALTGLILLITHIPEGTSSENTSASTNVNTNHKERTVLAQVTPSSHPDRPAAGMTGRVSQPGDKSASPVSQSKTQPGPILLASNNSSRILNAHRTNMPSLARKGSTSVTANPSVYLTAEHHYGIILPRDFSNDEISYLPILNRTSLFPNESEDTLLRFSNLHGITNVPLVTKARIPQFYSFNFGIAPELSIYRSADRYSESNYWLNAGMTYHAGRFSVQTGVGLGYVFDHGNYRVNYKSKDSIGYFTSIVSFIVNPGNVIVYTTKDVPVYDSLQHFADDRAVSRYTYLQIPLMLGYELVETNRFSLGIKAGPILSFLIGSREAAPFIDYPNARLIRVENNSLTRVRMNWEIQAALDLEYRLAKNFSIYAQPYYKHYFKPFATGESTTNPVKDPYSVGIEIGARFNFGLKRIKP